jgi:death-on-curing protein
VTIYPAVAEVLAIHQRLIAEFGGAMGVRDVGALESAVFRAQSGYYEDLMGEAAAMWESLSQNHPFVDGNKRVSITVTAAFLSVNGWRLVFDDAEAYRFLLDLYESGTFRRSQLEGWLRKNVEPR